MKCPHCKNEIDETGEVVVGVALHRFDFESIYAAYPHRLNQNKKAGMKRLSANIKNEQQFNDLKRAVENYSSYVKKERVEPQFIKTFGTFCSSFEDWIMPLMQVNVTQKPLRRAPEGMPEELKREIDPRDNSDPAFVKSLLDRALKRS
jgi:hypothetical protein